MAAYNYDQFIEETLENILNKTFDDFQLMVVDDGSTKIPPQSLKIYQKKDHRIILLQKENGGIISALEYGLLHCSAPFLARHDANDLSDPTRFKNK